MSRAFESESELPEKRFDTASTVREMTPFLFAAGERLAEVFLGLGAAAFGFEAAAAVRDLVLAGLAALVRFSEPVGLFAADVRVVVEAVRPFAVVFERADAVRFDDAALDAPLLAEVLALPALAEPLLEPPLRADALRAEVRPLLLAVVFLAVLRLLELRPPAEPFFDDEELADGRLLLAAAEVFFPAVLFFAVEPRDELLVERELEAFLAPLVERELEPAAFFLAPPLDERALEPEAFFLAPPDDDLDDEDRDDDELFFEPPLLLEPDDEREPLDFLVVAMQIIPPIVFGMILYKQQSAICVPFEVLYQVETS